MAQVKNNVLVKGMSGRIGKTLVFKVYGNKTVASRYPDMSRVKFTASQKAEQSLFARAAKYAHSIINDPLKKAAFQAMIGPDRKVYNAAISAYLNEHKRKV